MGVPASRQPALSWFLEKTRAAGVKRVKNWRVLRQVRAECGGFVQCQAGVTPVCLSPWSHRMGSGRCPAPSPLLWRCPPPAGPCAPGPAYVTFPKPDPEERGSPIKLGIKGFVCAPAALPVALSEELSTL